MGAKQIRGYYYEFIAACEMKYFSQNYYAEVNTPYIKKASNLNRLLGYWNIYEQFFPLNTLRRTIGYKIDENGKSNPIFDTDEELTTDEMERVEITDKEYWAKYHKDLIERYTDEYVQIAQYSDKIFEHCVMPCIAQFFDTPRKEYLTPLTDFYAHYWNDGKPINLPYVRKCRLIPLLFNSVLHRRRIAMWRRGVLIYSIPKWLYPIVDRFIH